jgi:peptidoglycan hydrolase-like protein with peptidoglycan-binding domain
LGSFRQFTSSEERRCGITELDRLWSAPSAEPLRAGSSAAAVGAVQELLAGQGSAALPGPLDPAYGVFGPRTSAAVRQFQSSHSLPEANAVDAAMLRALIAAPARDPRAGRAYVSLALGFVPEPLLDVVSLVSQMEGMGRFSALNLNTDGAGLSFGIIQWAQRPGRLAEILSEFQTADAARFDSIFGGGDSAVAGGLLRHVRRSNGGVTESGDCADPAYDLVSEPWVSRFRAAALEPAFQQAQVACAGRAFAASLAGFRSSAPGVTSERGVAFLLDVANQFGDAGVRRLCASVGKPGMTESGLLSAVAAASVSRMPARFQAGVRARRDAFLSTPWLSDTPFDAPA